MEKNSLALSKEGIFAKIKNKLLSLFWKKELNSDATNVEAPNSNNNNNITSEVPKLKGKNEFKLEVAVEENSDNQWILELKQKYDNGEILEKDISKEDMEMLIRIYNEESDQIKKDIEKRKKKIKTILAQMEQTNVAYN